MRRDAALRPSLSSVHERGTMFATVGSAHQNARPAIVESDRVGGVGHRGPLVGTGRGDRLCGHEQDVVGIDLAVGFGDFRHSIFAGQVKSNGHGWKLIEWDVSIPAADDDLLGADGLRKGSQGRETVLRGGGAVRSSTEKLSCARERQAPLSFSGVFVVEVSGLNVAAVPWGQLPSPDHQAFAGGIDHGRRDGG